MIFHNNQLYLCTHLHLRTHAHTLSPTHAHTHTCTHTYAHKHIHTYTHTYAYVEDIDFIITNQLLISIKRMFTATNQLILPISRTGPKTELSPSSVLQFHRLPLNCH